MTASAAGAAAFRVEFAGRDLGTMTLAERSDLGGGGLSLSTILDNTPFGVFDGRFVAVSKPDAARVSYASESHSTRKDREISFLIADGRASDILVVPASEATPLSLPDAVPVDVIDPVAAVGRFVHAAACPARFKIYDGRRVDEVVPAGSELSGGLLRCRIDYSVIAGPGHLSPFRFTEFGMVVTYDPARPAGQALRRIEMRTGLFAIRLIAVD